MQLVGGIQSKWKAYWRNKRIAELYRLEGQVLYESGEMDGALDVLIESIRFDDQS